MLKTLAEKFRVGWMLLLVVSILYGVGWAALNRTVGPPVDRGWGLIWDGDSLEFNATSAWTDSLWEMAYEMIETTTAVIPVADSALKYTHDGIKDYHIDWGTGTNQVSTDDVTEGSSNLFDQPLPDSADWSTAYSWGDHSSQNYLDEDNLGTWKVFYSDDGTEDWVELALGDNGTYLKSNGAAAAPSWGTPPGGDPGAAIDDSLTDGYEIWHKIDTTTATVPKSDDVDTSGTDIAAALSYRIGAGVITDSLWKSKPIVGGQFGHFVPVEDSMALYRGAARGTYFGFNLVYNFSEAADDQEDSVWISFIMPSESPDLDSLVIPAYFTSGDDVDSAGMTVHLFKKTEPLGDTTRIYNGTPLKTDHAWTHLAIAGASIDAIAAGNELIVLIVSKADPIDSVGFKDPIPYSPQT